MGEEEYIYRIKLKSGDYFISQKGKSYFSTAGGARKCAVNSSTYEPLEEGRNFTIVKFMLVEVSD